LTSPRARELDCFKTAEAPAIERLKSEAALLSSKVLSHVQAAEETTARAAAEYKRGEALYDEAGLRSAIHTAVEYMQRKTHELLATGLADTKRAAVAAKVRLADGTQGKVT
jgi:hypothetical protein